MKTLVLNANSDKKINHIILGRINTIFPKSKKHFVFKFLKNAPRSIQGVKDGLIAKSEMIKFSKSKKFYCGFKFSLVYAFSSFSILSKKLVTHRCSFNFSRH